MQPQPPSPPEFYEQFFVPAIFGPWALRAAVEICLTD
jgi:hypothetical protein